MVDANNTLPAPFPLEAAVNSTADVKNAELCADEITPNTQKTLTNTKKADQEWEAVAKRKGWVKKPKDKAMWEILMLISWITWLSMSFNYFLSYMTLATITGTFIFAWENFMPLVKEVGISFTTVVLGQATKLLTQWYERKQKEQES